MFIFTKSQWIVLLLIAAVSIFVVREAQESRSASSTSKVAALFERAKQVTRHFSSSSDRGILSSRTDPGHVPIRDQYLKSLFIPDQTTHFTEMKRGHAWHSCEIEGLKISSAKPHFVNHEMRKNGTKEKLSYSVGCQRYRLFEPEAGWSEWQTDAGIDFGEFSMVRRRGHWSIEDTSLAKLLRGSADPSD